MNTNRPRNRCLKNGAAAVGQNKKCGAEIFKILGFPLSNCCTETSKKRKSHAT